MTSSKSENWTSLQEQGNLFQDHIQTFYRNIAKSAWLLSAKKFTSIGLNSTLHPMLLLGGGGLNLMVCQLVDWIFCERNHKQSGEGPFFGGG